MVRSALLAGESEWVVTDPGALDVSEFPKSSSRWLSAGIAPVPGRLKSCPEDFQVEEIPLYEPSGKGQHLYLWVEKTGIPTFEAIRRLCAATGFRAGAVGYAGLKDAQAVTRQWISVDGLKPDEAAGLEIPGMTILEARLHRNKLKLGHLRGNRFRLRLRESTASAARRAVKVLELLAARGMPNFFGKQRFGASGMNDELGRALLHKNWEGFLFLLLSCEKNAGGPRGLAAMRAFRAGKLRSSLEQWPYSCTAQRKAIRSLQQRPEDPARAVRSIPKNLRRFYLASYQSRLFNRYLHLELPRLDAVEAGAVYMKRENRAPFRLEENASDDEISSVQRRLRSFSIDPSGPLFGTKMCRPTGRCREVEDCILDEEGLSWESWRAARKAGLDGGRRPLRAAVGELRTEVTRDGLIASFTLPRGAYATELFDEILKPET